MASQIADAVARVTAHLEKNPDDGYGWGTDATATIEGLRATAVHPEGAVVVTDMPEAIGGGGSAPSPGWLLRAALATCDAPVIAMRAASQDVVLDSLDVTVAFDFDDRGLVGTDDTVPAGPLSSKVTVRIGAKGVAVAKLTEIVEWADRHSPVGDALGRAVPGRIVIESLTDG